MPGAVIVCVMGVGSTNCVNFGELFGEEYRPMNIALKKLKER